MKCHIEGVNAIANVGATKQVLGNGGQSGSLSSGDAKDQSSFSSLLAAADAGSNVAGATEAVPTSDLTGKAKSDKGSPEKKSEKRSEDEGDSQGGQNVSAPVCILPTPTLDVQGQVASMNRDFTQGNSVGSATTQIAAQIDSETPSTDRASVENLIASQMDGMQDTSVGKSAPVAAEAQGSADAQAMDHAATGIEGQASTGVQEILSALEAMMSKTESADQADLQMRTASPAKATDAISAASENSADDAAGVTQKSLESSAVKVVREGRELPAAEQTGVQAAVQAAEVASQAVPVDKDRSVRAVKGSADISEGSATHKALKTEAAKTALEQGGQVSDRGLAPQVEGSSSGSATEQDASSGEKDSGRSGVGVKPASERAEGVAAGSTDVLSGSAYGVIASQVTPRQEMHDVAGSQTAVVAKSENKEIASASGEGVTNQLQSARLVQNALSSELHVGLQSKEFGNISINASSTHAAMSAQISVNHEELAQTLTAQITEMQEKGGGIQMNVHVDMHGAGADASSYQGGGSQEASTGGAGANSSGGGRNSEDSSPRYAAVGNQSMSRDPAISVVASQASSARASYGGRIDITA